MPTIRQASATAYMYLYQKAAQRHACERLIAGMAGDTPGIWGAAILAWGAGHFANSSQMRQRLVNPCFV